MGGLNVFPGYGHFVCPPMEHDWMRRTLLFGPGIAWKNFPIPTQELPSSATITMSTCKNCGMVYDLVIEGGA